MRSSGHQETTIAARTWNATAERSQMVLCRYGSNFAPASTLSTMWAKFLVFCTKNFVAFK
jgi:hypothetical protein